MKNSFWYILIALVLTISNAMSQAPSLNETVSNLTANILLPFDDAHTQQLSKVYWLPDYLGGNTGYNERSNDSGKNDSSTACDHEKPDTSIYDYTTTMEKGSICYHKRCKEKFIYNSSNCSGEYQVSGSSCEGNSVDCVGKPCSAGGYYDQTQSDKRCSSETYGGKTCHSCYTPSCAEGGYQTRSSKDGFICTSTTYYGQDCYSCSTDPCYGLAEAYSGSFGCQTFYEQCSEKCEVAYKDNCHNRTAVSEPYGCESYFEDCASKCEVAYADNCRNREDKSCEHGCTSKYGDCASKCESCKGDPDCDVTEKTCEFGCAATNGCGKCTSCKKDNCDVRTNNVSTMGCTKYYDDCDSKCETPWLCKIGDIYYTERDSGVCYSPQLGNYDTKPLGVVVYVTEDGVHGQVASIDPLFDTTGSFVTYQWGDFGDTSEQTKYDHESDFASCTNTNNLLLDNKHPAAIAARSYAPTNITNGKWCLPAAGILKSWTNNKVIIDESFKILRSKQFDIINAPYWSSTGADYTRAWYVSFSDFGCCDSLTVEDKSYAKYVRPVLEF